MEARRALRARWRRLRRETRDLAVVLLAYLVTTALCLRLDAFEALVAFVAAHEAWEIDEWLTALLVLPFACTAYALRRLQDARREAARRRRAEALSRHLAVVDPLTGLPNRRRLMEALALRLESHGAAEAVAVLLIDLDRFKPVNDLHGHATGDRLLQAAAGRLAALARPEDMVARLGGDEFVILATLEAGGPDAAGAADTAARLARRVATALEQPFVLEEQGGGEADRQVQVGASLGIAILHGGPCPPEEALRRADLAMYRAKAEGRGGIRIFEAEMDQRMRARLALEAELRRAIAAEALVPHFQPLVALGAAPGGSGRLIGFEMLARWPHPVHGLVPPDRFIPLAEETGLIGPLTRQLLRRACRAAAAWPAPLVLAVNVSPLQLRDRTLPAMVAEALAESGLPPARLEIELTESALVENFDLARELLGALKALGIKLSLDDFGTGYSSLRHLRALPFDKIKVDRDFIRDMTQSSESSKIVAAVIGLSHSLGLPAVAEGIEDAGTATRLAEMGCDIGQGWLFGRPVAEAEAARLAAIGPLPEGPARLAG
ncbi:putative bifunctional diguanylate cyclase/phosphodiesterase [Teichococcus aestuarii]|uniref:putative bifunctional diguanylate cyclase/phosphodiesterase n=1 Tax=Teichococcus aestuarii TaxID=568898 RepID=UPI003622F17A